MELKNNLIYIDKPKGITSFDVIRKLRKKLNIRKMGHAGTLDPLATGLLIVGIGEGTKKLEVFLKLPKTYIADILLGLKTDTGDIDGKILEEREVNVEKQDILEKGKEMVGVHEIKVPIYSAIKQGGEALYKKARRGDRVDAPKKKMEVKRFEILFIKNNLVKIEIDVSSGTYIRSIAEEFGKRLNCPATVKELRRTKVGDIDISQAEKLN